MPKPGFYAVARGRAPGIYTSWLECEAQVKGYVGAKFKKFDTVYEAANFNRISSSSSSTSNAGWSANASASKSALKPKALDELMDENNELKNKIEALMEENESLRIKYEKEKERRQELKATIRELRKGKTEDDVDSVQFNDVLLQARDAAHEMELLDAKRQIASLKFSNAALQLGGDIQDRLFDSKRRIEEDAPGLPKAKKARLTRT